MSLPVSNRVQWERLVDIARRNEDILRKADFFFRITQLSAAFTFCCGLGYIATDQPAGKERSLANKVFLGASLVGAGALVCSLVAAIALIVSSMAAAIALTVSSMAAMACSNYRYTKI